MNDTRQNIELIQNTYVAFGRGDIPAILATMTEVAGLAAQAGRLRGLTVSEVTTLRVRRWSMISARPRSRAVFSPRPQR